MCGRTVASCRHLVQAYDGHFEEVGKIEESGYTEAGFDCTNSTESTEDKMSYSLWWRVALDMLCFVCTRFSDPSGL